jgi:hypothetical protein
VADRGCETPPATTKLRDPRTLKLLDPACGSMHFGLYAFDLFETIYAEYWDLLEEFTTEDADEERFTTEDTEYTEKERTGNILSSVSSVVKTDYVTRAAFLRDVPRLIIEHDIYGVDIDPRAA